MQQVILGVEIFVDLPVDLNVLHASVENDHDFHIDCKIVQIRYQSFKDELESAVR